MPRTESRAADCPDARNGNGAASSHDALARLQLFGSTRVMSFVRASASAN
jgi:hypothetical protein